MMTQPSVGAVLDQLASEGLLVPETDVARLQVPRLPDDVPGTPWYVRLFAGLSAWLAALLLIAFLFTADIIDFQHGSLGIGLFFCGVAVSLKLSSLGRRAFFDQLALVFSMAGQLLFIFGAGEWLDDATRTALLTIVLQCVLILLYRDWLGRWLSTLAIVGAVLVILADQALSGALHALVVALALAAVVLYQQQDRLDEAELGELAQPIAYGLVVGLLGLLALPLTEALEVRHWWISAALLAGVLLVLIRQIAQELELPLSSPVVLGCMAATLLLLAPAARMPGILAALIVLLLGFWRGRPLLLGLAALFLVFYLGAYYYTLEWTLLVKSFMLAGSGAILLGLRLLLLRAAPGGQL